MGRTVPELFGGTATAAHVNECRLALAGAHRIYMLDAVLAGGTRHLRVSLSPLRGVTGEVAGLVMVGQDVTQARQAEQDLKQRDERLQEVQRVESLGRLAGGVAHDFNNLLTIINGYCDLLLGGGTLGAEEAQRIGEIAKAGERAATLTGQLLAFGRRQVLQPRIMNLNETVGEMSAMLQRLIGEDVQLTTRLAPGLGRVRADPGRIGQVIMNLAVNARDAMPNGGKLIMETSDVELHAEYTRWHDGLQPGSYVQLAVSDNGIGMDRATQARVFEPFFTTKPLGKGTGLGLSTVYGIVRQSEGEILLYSEPGRGTTFKVYLPRVNDPLEVRAPVAGPVQEALRGTETILVAEDETVIRILARQVFESHGYTVLEAADGHQALTVVHSSPGPIHLLLTDVVMPHLSGPELVRQLGDLGHTMKVLFMSGYTDTYLEELGRTVPGSGFIQKPVRPEALLREVRRLLDTPPRVG